MEELILKWKEFIESSGDKYSYIHNIHNGCNEEIKEPSFYDFMQWLSKPKEKVKWKRVK